MYAIRCCGSPVRIAAILLGLAACASNQAVGAEVRAKPLDVVMLNGGSEQSARANVDAFRAGMKEAGWIDGRSMTLTIRYANGVLERFPKMVAEVVALKPDVMVVGTYVGIAAAKSATKTIPIVGSSCGMGQLVASLARPGGNLTGMTCQSQDLVAKRLEILQALMAGSKLMGVLYNPAAQFAAEELRDLRSAAARMGLRLVEAKAGSPEQFGPAAQQLQQAGVAAVMTVADGMYFHNRVALVEHFQRLPLMGFYPEFSEAGALVSYGANEQVQYRRLASYVDRIAKGARPAALPVEQPTAFELVINKRAAKALNISLPESLLARADRVIE